MECEGNAAWREGGWKRVQVASIGSRADGGVALLSTQELSLVYIRRPTGPLVTAP